VTPVVPPFGFELQQSLSVRQRSPSTWQPFAGWHTLTPVKYGAQSRLQHWVQSVQITPSGADVQLDPPMFGGLTHVPMPPVPPSGLSEEQRPVQHSALLLQMSFVWTQNDDSSEHVPLPAHRPEQQAGSAPPSGPGEVHGFPEVLQAPLSGVHVPPPHFCPQHCVSVVHGWLSAVHVAAQAPATHASEQQSSAEPHTPPAWWQVAIDAAQVFVVGSHLFEQHCPSVVQTWPKPLRVQNSPASTLLASRREESTLAFPSIGGLASPAVPSVPESPPPLFGWASSPPQPTA
jgi:hypothetical protein